MLVKSIRVSFGFVQFRLVLLYFLEFELLFMVLSQYKSIQAIYGIPSLY